MKRINLLDIETSNKIAAGEVVERPLSVVKELIENSIDSGAKNITIELIDGGEKLIRVIDDGSGIHRDDVKKAFLPHATSKIVDALDIFKINTLGFRGEALPSIASVSKIRLKSKTYEDDLGCEIEINAGTIIRENQVGMNNGTIIEVEDLFFNVPARKKFLKSSQRESTLINDIISRISLSFPEVSFKLYNNNKLILATLGNGSLNDAVMSIYGKETAKNVSSFEGCNDISTIHGFIGNQELSRGSRNNQNIFINNRYIKNKMITTAVENAVRSFFTINKYPFFILFIDIFPEFVDVNVHPTKSEVKFQDERVVFKIVFDTIHKAIKESIRETFEINEEFTVNEPLQKTYEPIVSVQLPIDLKVSDEVINYQKPFINENLKKDSLVEDNNSVYNNQLPVKDGGLVNINANLNEEKNSEQIKPNKLQNLKIIGQLFNTYILLEGEDGLYMVDQHAAHEKILFERYMKDISNKTVISQILVTSEILELSNDDFQYYLENKDVFEAVGFKLEVFGENTICIKEVPLLLGKPEVKSLFLSLMDNIKNLGSGSASELKYNKIASISCRGAIKANDKLKYEEMLSLINQMNSIDDPFNCPHGRPTIIKISQNELEKRFKRIQ